MLPCEFGFLEDEECFFSLAERTNRTKSKTEFLRRPSNVDETDLSPTRRERLGSVIDKNFGVPEAAAQQLIKLQQAPQQFNQMTNDEAGRPNVTSSQRRIGRPLVVLALTQQSSRDSETNYQDGFMNNEVDFLLD